MSNLESLENNNTKRRELPLKEAAGITFAGLALAACTAKPDAPRIVPSPSECSPAVVMEGSNATNAAIAAAEAAYAQAASRGESGTEQSSEDFVGAVSQPLAAELNDLIAANEIPRYSTAGETFTVCIDPERPDNITVLPDNSEAKVSE